MAIYPPTATFKGEHDGVGNLDKVLIDDHEKNDVLRAPTTRHQVCVYTLLMNIIMNDKS